MHIILIVLSSSISLLEIHVHKSHVVRMCINVCSIQVSLAMWQEMLVGVPEGWDMLVKMKEHGPRLSEISCPGKNQGRGAVLAH